MELDIDQEDADPSTDDKAGLLALGGEDGTANCEGGSRSRLSLLSNCQKQWRQGKSGIASPAKQTVGAEGGEREDGERWRHRLL